MSDRVTGIGGIFFTTENSKELQAWYDKHLGLNFGGKGYDSFQWKEQDTGKQGSTVFSFFKKGTDYLKPSTSPFMINFRVKNLDLLLEQLREEGVTIVGEIDRQPYGNFAWIMDPDGNKIELWEPTEG
ncbi:MAG: VOC family protein [Bacteroidia bacterium]